MSSLPPVSLSKDLFKISFARNGVYIRCNHCNTELALQKEPIPFNLCSFIGFLSTVIPAVYFLFIIRLGFDKSILYAAIIGLFAVIIISILTFNRSYFKIA